MYLKRTDLALESRDCFRSGSGREPAGVDIEEYDRQGVDITKIIIRDEKGEQTLGKPRGTYITASLKSDWLKNPDWILNAAQILAGLLAPLIPQKGPVLVTGLGNRGITPDNLGPSAIDNIMVTRHLMEQMPDVFGDMRPVCAMSTGVLGLTGIETAEIVKGVSQRVEPCCIIAIDALTAMSSKRLCRTFQISDTGIVPGSGACNARNALSREALGVPVIAMGVPTVIDSRTLVADALEKAGAPAGADGIVGSETMLVTPKDIDALIKKSAKVIGYAVNFALHGQMSVAEMEQYLA